jgi:hypothetical protein
MADGPCWVLRLPNGEEADLGAWEDTHYSSEEEAAEAVKEMCDGYAGLSPVRLPEQCWTATAACGYRYDEDAEGVEHALGRDREWFLAAVLAAGWKPVVGGGFTCGDDGCDECADQPVAIAAPEMPGQTALLGGGEPTHA